MQIDDIQPGMRLAKDVYDPNGNVLIRAGADLTERHIKALKTWGVSDVTVAADQADEDEPTRNPRAIAEIRAMLDSQFSLSNREHPVVQAIYDLCLERALASGRSTQ